MKALVQSVPSLLLRYALKPLCKFTGLVSIKMHYDKLLDSFTHSNVMLPLISGALSDEAFKAV